MAHWRTARNPHQWAKLQNIGKELFSLYQRETDFEIWKPIRGYEGLYSISNLGRVKREKRVIVNRRGTRQVMNERILKPYHRKGKGLEVTLCKDDHKRTFLVHVLQREHFETSFHD
jgi:hypothetical protein